MSGKRKSILEAAQAEAQQEIASKRRAREAAAKARLEDERKALRKQVKGLAKEVEQYQSELEVLERLRADPLKPHRIRRLEKRKSVREGVGCLLLSDLHFEERVDARTVNGLNEFNLEIAKERTAALGVGFRWYLDKQRARLGTADGYKIRQLWMPLLGDTITNNLREDDLRGNFLDPFPAVVFAAERLVEIYDYALEDPEIESIFVPMVVGNHDRMPGTRRQTSRDRTERSLAYLLADKLAGHYRDEPRIKFELSYSAHHYTSMYGRDVRSCHGDGFKYNKGVGGIYVAARRYIARLNATRPAALTVFGHHHQYKLDRDWVSNGSLIGYSEYAANEGFEFEQAGQVCFVLDRDRGPRLSMQIGLQGDVQW